MSDSTRSITRIGLIALALILEGLVAYWVVTNSGSGIADLFASVKGFATLGVHIVGAALLAAGFGGFLSGGKASDRASVVVLYFVMAFTLPIAGAVGVALLARLLARGGIEAEGESEFLIGNKLLEDLAHGEDAPAEPHLDPLVASAGGLAVEEVGRMVLALRNRGHLPGVEALLHRFQRERSSEIQFFAQSALSAASDGSEQAVADQRQRLEANPKDVGARIALAELLLETASRRDTSKQDRGRICEEIIEHLQAAIDIRPGAERLRALMAQAYLLTGDQEAARKQLASAGNFGTEAVLECLLHARDLEALAETAAKLSARNPQLATALAFWRDGGKGAAA